MVGGGRGRLWLGFALVCAALLVWWLLGRPASAPAPRDAAPAAAPPDTPTDPGAPPAAVTAEEQTELPEAVQRYLETTVYPPTSGRLGPEAVDLLEPNRRYEDFKRLPGAPGVDPNLSFLWTCDRYQYTSDQVIEARFEAKNGDAPAVVDSLDAWAQPESREGEVGEPLRLRFREEGGAWLAELDLAALLPEHHGPVALVARYRIADLPEREERIRVFVTPAAAVPARFTGNFRDRVEDGSLLVEVGIEVDLPGFYRLDANLYKGTTPVGWATYKGTLGRSDGTAPLRFFGKVIHDAGHAGPYEVGEVRGYLFREAEFPDRLHMRSYRERWQTEAWKLSQFSDDEWDDPQRRRMVELMLEDEKRGISLDLPEAPAPEPDEL